MQKIINGNEIAVLLDNQNIAQLIKKQQSVMKMIRYTVITIFNMINLFSINTFFAFALANKHFVQLPSLDT